MLPIRKNYHFRNWKLWEAATWYGFAVLLNSCCVCVTNLLYSMGSNLFGCAVTAKTDICFNALTDYNTLRKTIYNKINCPVNNIAVTSVGFSTSLCQYFWFES